MKMSYMKKQGKDWIVCHWDDKVKCYFESPMSYWKAKIAVGTSNCQKPKTCKKVTHQHD